MEVLYIKVLGPFDRDVSIESYRRYFGFAVANQRKILDSSYSLRNPCEEFGRLEERVR